MQPVESKQLKQFGEQFIHVLLARTKYWLDEHVLANIGEQIDPDGVNPTAQLSQVATSEATIVQETHPVPHIIH